MLPYDILTVQIYRHPQLCLGSLCFRPTFQLVGPEMLFSAQEDFPWYFNVLDLIPDHSKVRVNPVASSSSVLSFLISPFWELFPAKGCSEGFSPEGPSFAKASGEIYGFSFGGLLSLLQCPCPFSQLCLRVLWVMNIEY